MAADNLLCLNDFKAYMKEHILKAYYDYIEGAADEGWTLENNLSSWKKLRIRPNYLTGLKRKEIDTSLDIFGLDVKSPIWIAPCALHGLVHADKEIATAKACKQHGNIMIASAGSTASYKDIINASDNKYLGAQIDVPKTTEAIDKLIERLEALDYKFIALNIDFPIIGNRLHNAQNKFCVPENLSMPNAEQMVIDVLGSENDSMKGVLTYEDAYMAYKHGADAVIVSNHGGRQLDSVPSTLAALPEVVAAVGSKIPVFVDGGIRHGSDVFKAIALGAKAVFIGRPIFWGLAYNGAEGVANVLDILQKELEDTMMLAGCEYLESITKNHIVHESTLEASLANSCYIGKH